MAKRVAVGPQLLLQHGSARPRLDARRPRRRVDLDDSVEQPEVDRDSSRVPVADVALHAADDRRAGAVGNRGGVGIGAPVQDVDDLGFVARRRNDVGRMVETALEGAHDVSVRLPVRVPGA